MNMIVQLCREYNLLKPLHKNHHCLTQFWHQCTWMEFKLHKKFQWGLYHYNSWAGCTRQSPSLSRCRSSGIRLAFTPELEGCFKGFERKINGWALGAPGVVLQHSFGRSESTVRQQCINTILRCVPSCATVAAGSNRLALWRIVATLVLTQVESQKVFQVILCKFWGVILWERVTDKYRPKLHSLIGSNLNHLILFMMTQCGYIIIHLTNWPRVIIPSLLTLHS